MQMPEVSLIEWQKQFGTERKSPKHWPRFSLAQSYNAPHAAA